MCAAIRTLQVDHLTAFEKRDYLSRQSLVAQLLEDNPEGFPLETEINTAAPFVLCTIQLTWATVNTHRCSFLMPEPAINDWTYHESIPHQRFQRLWSRANEFSFLAARESVIREVKTSIAVDSPSAMPPAQKHWFGGIYRVNDTDRNFLSMATISSAILSLS